MGGGPALSSSVPSLPPPCPRSPLVCPDLSGRRREIVKIQLLERERSFLERELEFIETLQPASTCCKEVVEFVNTKSDPFIPMKKKVSKRCRLWKWICKSPCLIFSWICCCTGCSIRLKMPDCHCCATPCNCCTCSGCCSLPKLSCSGCLPCSSCSCSCCCRQVRCPKCKIPSPKCSCKLQSPCCCKSPCPCCCKVKCPKCTVPTCCTNMFSCSCTCPTPSCTNSNCCANPCSCSCPKCTSCSCPKCTGLNCCADPCSCCADPCSCSCSCPKCSQVCCCFNCRKNCCNNPRCCFCF